MNLNIEVDEYIKQKHYRQINSILLWQGDRILVQRHYNGFDAERRNVIRSVAKSIMSICTGIALDKGLIKSLDEPISRYIPEFNEYREMLHKAITVRHLLTMSSGVYFNGGIHYHCPMFEQVRRSGNWISHIADVAVTNIPGTQYCYKEWDVILLAKLLDNACGDMYDFIDENLYKPLEIKSRRWYRTDCGVYYSVAKADEGKEERSSNLTAQEMLKIGQLFLNKGMFEGTRIVSEEYVLQAVAPSKCSPGYGFLWWRGEDWYGCRGFGGQNITVVPNKNAVFIMQASPTSRGMGYEDVTSYCLGLV